MNKIYIVLVVAAFAQSGSALPLPSPEIEHERDLWLHEISKLHPFSVRPELEYNFEGIAELSNCSGSLIRFVQSQPSDRALIMTNGHCIGKFPDPGEAVMGIGSSRTFNLLGKNGRTLAGTVQADLLVYATMTKTDMAIYRLRQTYQEILSRYKTEALLLAEQGPPVGVSIQVLSGYWHRGYACQVDKIVHELKEGDWVSEQSLRYSQPGCETIGGTSGSPIIATQSHTVVGVNNTGNENGERCTTNNPCEVDENGKVDYAEGRSYGQQTAWIYSCLTANRELDVRVPGCLLFH